MSLIGKVGLSKGSILMIAVQNSAALQGFVSILMLDAATNAHTAIITG